ncbi:piggyBac transposable element-derived protein 4-like [Eriocheir sinensis]|uniref:piggyBac transposable element-derived protein 4-like n=1 Tax=Eriocheir sinensis TaxID=95602 RepID=UPI0021C727F0|nr:piggyBac transposable element-derived protein 4-like [Eriocheir sinensis]
MWSEGSDFVPLPLAFQGSPVGITDAFKLPETPAECDYFLAYFDNDLVDLIVRETNRYFHQTIEDKTEEERKAWKDVTREELLTFIAITLLMPHSRKSVLDDYWLRDVLFMPVFPTYFTRGRYPSILKNIHFADHAHRNEADPLWKIPPLMNNILQKFKVFFNPFQKLVIDESLMLFKGRLHFKQYIPSKRHRFGIKMFILCDCETGIALDVCIYSTSDIDLPKGDPLGVSGAVVKLLMEKYLGKGHMLYTDNCYTSPALAKFLIDHGTGAAGTVKENRKNMPHFHPSKRGDVQKHKCDGILVIRWHDKKEVHLLSTIHRGEIPEKHHGKRVRKLGSRML